MREKSRSEPGECDQSTQSADLEEMLDDIRRSSPSEITSFSDNVIRQYTIAKRLLDFNDDFQRF